MTSFLQSAGGSPLKARKMDANSKVQAMVLEVFFDVSVQAKGLAFDGGIVGVLADADELVCRKESKNAVRWMSGLISKNAANVPEWATAFNAGLPQNVVAEYMSPSHQDNPTAVVQETAEGGIANAPGAWCFGMYTQTFEEFRAVLRQLIGEAMGVNAVGRPGGFSHQGGASKLLFRENTNSTNHSRWTSWHSVQIRPVGLVADKYVDGLLDLVQEYPFLVPSGALCACAVERFRSVFTACAPATDLTGVAAKVKAREDKLIAEHFAAVTLSVDAGQRGAQAEMAKETTAAGVFQMSMAGGVAESPTAGVEAVGAGAAPPSAAAAAEVTRAASASQVATAGGVAASMAMTLAAVGAGADAVPPARAPAGAPAVGAASMASGGALAVPAVAPPAGVAGDAQAPAPAAAPLAHAVPAPTAAAAEVTVGAYLEAATAFAAGEARSAAQSAERAKYRAFKGIQLDIAAAVKRFVEMPGVGAEALAGTVSRWPAAAFPADRLEWAQRLTIIEGDMAAAAAARDMSPEAAVAKIVAKLDRFLESLQADAQAAMLADDMAKLDGLEPLLDGLEVLLVLVRDSPPTGDLLRALEPMENAETVSALNLDALAAVAAAVPRQGGAGK
ncbi:unnamed protein product [Prorocentrum cordatum]|uniref:Uncharacterized protein n=1 Tax=Prorocentrum cordatum TaxID=2364126 RepID=A0ABN9U6G4_9DINO|nr:unnamed protein product [Polarella glacialis]